MYLQRDYLSSESIRTVYFGGGTPSILREGQIHELLHELSKYFKIDKEAEVTLEANPDDLSIERLTGFSRTDVNRLSIGIQSFRDEDLRFLNRAHTGVLAIESVQNAKKAGFKNISIDLIYGIPTLSNEQWKRNIEIAIALDIPHISCYSLTVESQTALASFIKSGKAPSLDMQKSAEQFEILIEIMKKNDFIHYEISNFCKEGAYSCHNSSYWKGEKYLGIGPSAHSYDGSSRQWNVKSNAAYISHIQKDRIPYEKELLSESQRYNEYILTSLRTLWGADTEFIRFNISDIFFNHFNREIQPYLENRMLRQENGKIILTDRGKLFADKIISELFFIS